METAERIFNATQAFFGATGKRVGTIYLGRSQYSELMASEPFRIKASFFNDKRKTFNGCLIYVVDDDNHLGVTTP